MTDTQGHVALSDTFSSSMYCPANAVDEKNQITPLLSAFF